MEFSRALKEIIRPRSKKVKEYVQEHTQSPQPEITQEQWENSKDLGEVLDHAYTSGQVNAPVVEE